MSASHSLKPHRLHMISRNWATPLTIGAFLLMAVTGILMFFHLDVGLNKEAHEWLGWAMVVGVLAHVTANWSGLARHFQRPAAKATVGLFSAVLVGSFFLGGEEGGNPARLALQTLTQAPLSQVAALRGESDIALVTRLQAAGFSVSGPDQTLAAVAGKDREQLMKALNAALPPN